jgi:hypothetical protein
MKFLKKGVPRVISGFHHEVDKNRILLAYYTVTSGKSLPMFWNNP